MPWEDVDLEVQQHLKDCLFHGVCKHIRDPSTSYLQLIVATHKVESENEGIWDKVRARAAVATDSSEGTIELGQQIAKLMVALTQVRQGSSPASTPSSPRERGCGRGCTDRGNPGHPSSHNSWNRLGQTAPDHSTLTGHGTGAAISRNQGQSIQGINARHEGATNRKDSNSL